MAGQGFASKTKQEREKISSKAGRTAHKKGKAHEWTKEDATKASQKAAAARKKNAILRAAQRLFREGFTVQDLNTLKLTAPEYNYYGGKDANPTRYKELRERLDALQTATERKDL